MKRIFYWLISLDLAFFEVEFFVAVFFTAVFFEAVFFGVPFLVADFFGSSYNGEEITSQAGIEIVNINGTGISANAASEAFDEPLTKEQVLMIVDPFIVA